MSSRFDDPLVVPAGAISIAAGATAPDACSPGAPGDKEQTAIRARTLLNPAAVFGREQLSRGEQDGPEHPVGFVVFAGLPCPVEAVVAGDQSTLTQGLAELEVERREIAVSGLVAAGDGEEDTFQTRTQRLRPAGDASGRSRPLFRRPLQTLGGGGAEGACLNAPDEQIAVGLERPAPTQAGVDEGDAERAVRSQ